MEYSTFVQGLIKSPLAIDGELSPAKINLWHMATGICGEATEVFTAVMCEDLIKELGDIEFYLEGFRQELGIDRNTALTIQYPPPKPKEELMCFSGMILDEVKKHVINGKMLDSKTIDLLLLSVEICLHSIRIEIGPITRNEVITANMDKLNKRYKNGYSDQEAITKADQK